MTKKRVDDFLGSEGNYSDFVKLQSDSLLLRYPQVRNCAIRK